MQYFFLGLLWVLWCALHSALISLSVTEPLRRRFPEWFRYYRICYNLVAVVSLIPILCYALTLPSVTIVSWQGLWWVVPVLLGSCALLLFVAGARRYDMLQFLGLRQLQNDQTCSVLTDDCSLDTGGVLAIVRHPWYSGGMLIVWARPLDMSAILTNLVVCGYFVVGAILEERKLRVQFGQAYADYQQRVSMFFPIKWVKQLFTRQL